jgi:hypothetical protein
MARGGDFVVPGHDLGFMASIPATSALTGDVFPRFEAPEWLTRGVKR